MSFSLVFSYSLAILLVVSEDRALFGKLLKKLAEAILVGSFDFSLFALTN